MTIQKFFWIAALAALPTAASAQCGSGSCVNYDVDDQQYRALPRIEEACGTGDC
jgi:hypothetical protein